MPNGKPGKGKSGLEETVLLIEINYNGTFVKRILISAYE
jgi:hypothetical protein